MIFKIKRSFVALTLLLSSTHHSDAIIPTTAFKGISGFFEEYHYAPTLGKVALDVGLISNFRFYGPYTQGIKDDGTRDYVKDASEDPLWNLVFQLFPSTGGTFTSETTGSSNIGHYLNDTKTVALLLDYAYQVRKNSADEKKTTKTILDTFMKPDKGLKKNIPDILKSIKDSIDKEGDFYPSYTTEQIILAFLCHKFNTQDDLKSFIKALNKINNKIVPDFNSNSLDTLTLFTQNEIEEIKNKEFQGIDDIYNLANADIFTRMTPYKPGSELLSNGNAYPYDRKNNKIMEGKKTFADCTETTLRHLVNMLTYDAKAKQFDLSHLKKHVGENNPYFQNMEDFYKFQTPNHANSGDITIRSLWNTVVSDLKNDDKLINYKQGTFELRARYINVIQVFKKLFNLQLPDEQKELESLDVAKVAIYKQKQWVEAYLSALFNALNPNRSYDISTSKLYWDSGEQDIFGELEVKVKNDKNPLFSFIMDLSPGHGKLSQLKDFQEQAIINFSKFTEKARESNTSIQSLLLLTRQFQSQAKSVFYRLYPCLMEDNKAWVNALQSLNEITNQAIKNDSFGSEMQQRMEQILGNILSEISWGDQGVIMKISPVIFNLSKVYSDIPLKYVKKLYLDLNKSQATDEQLKKLLSGCSQLEYLWLGNSKNITQLSLKGLKKLKNLALCTSSVKQIDGLSECTSLEEFWLSDHPKLKSVSVEGLKNLNMLSLNNIGVEQIDGLSELTALEELGLSSTNIKQLSITGLKKLEKLNLAHSSIEEIEGLSECATLKDLNLIKTKFKQFSVNGLKNLTTLNIAGSDIQQIDGLSECTALTNFSSHNTKLKKFSVKWLKNLKEISVNSSEIEEIEGLEDLVALERIFIWKVPNLSEKTREAINKLQEKLPNLKVRF
jgi:hypothetical protein